MNEKKVLLGIAAGTLAISAGLGWLLYSTWEEIGQTETQIEEKRADLEAARKKTEQVKGLEDQVIVLRESVAALASVLPTQQEVEDFVKAMSGFAKDKNVRLTEVRPKSGGGSRTGQSKVFERIGYQLKTEATLSNFLAFLNRVESFKRFVIVPYLKLSNGARSNTEETFVTTDANHTVEFDIETYAYNPAKGGVREPIPNYEARRAQLREEIDHKKETIEQPAVEWTEQKNRRDIFVDPRTPPTDANQLSLEQQQELVAKLQLRIEELTGLFAEFSDPQLNIMRRFEIQAIFDEKVGPVEADVARVEKEKVLTVDALRRSWRGTVSEPLKKVRAGLKDLGTVGPSARELSDLLVRARDLVRAGQVREAIDFMKPVLERAPSFEQDAVRAPYVAELRKLDREARVAQRFEDKKVTLGGIIVEPQRKVAVVNNRTMEPGDSVDDELTVADISEDGVTFVLDEVQITKKW